MREAFRPYRVVALVSGALILIALAGAITWPIALDWTKAWLLALSSGLSACAVIGTCRLVGITVDHVEKRTHLPEIRQATRDAMRERNANSGGKTS